VHQSDNYISENVNFQCYLYLYISLFPYIIGKKTSFKTFCYLGFNGIQVNGGHPNVEIIERTLKSSNKYIIIETLKLLQYYHSNKDHYNLK
jgi:hypothetical protein